jgi:hypothetical protein
VQVISLGLRPRLPGLADPEIREFFLGFRIGLLANWGLGCVFAKIGLAIVVCFRSIGFINFGRGFRA